MAEFRRMRRSDLPETEETQSAPENGSDGYFLEEGLRYCAYNLTRGRFLSTEIEASGFPSAALEDCLAKLGPGSQRAIWISPFRGLSPTSFRFPIDLITLDQRCAALEAIECFPVSIGSGADMKAASALLLPVHTLSSGCVKAGDQLILCTPEEMEGNLRSLMDPDFRSLESLGADGSGNDAEMRRFMLRSLGNAVYWSDRAKSAATLDPADAVHPDPPNQTSSDELTRETLAEQFAWNRPQQRKNWFLRWWAMEPKDPRAGVRETLPGLVANFLTGSRPSAHGIRNISATGLYVLTKERWYLGTIIRVNLCDRQEKTFERSITLSAKVVRWGNDGVGLQFVLKRRKDHVAEDEDLSGGVTPRLLEEFLRKYRDNHLADQD